MSSPCVRASRIRRYGRSRTQSPAWARASSAATRSSYARKRVAGADRPELARDRRRSGSRSTGNAAAVGTWSYGKFNDFIASRRHSLRDFRLLGDGQARPSRALPLIVGESEPVAVDRDEVFLIEDWHLRPDGAAITPGTDPKDTVPIYTVNGRTALDVPVRTNERLRLAL